MSTALTENTRGIPEVARTKGEHDPAVFGVIETACGHTIQAERVRDTLGELLAFSEAPDYGYMMELERSGEMVLFTARRIVDNAMVNSLNVYVAHDERAASLLIDQVACRGTLAVQLLCFAEDRLYSIGVGKVCAEVGFTGHVVDKLMRSLGYHQTSINLTKALGSDEMVAAILRSAAKADNTPDEEEAILFPSNTVEALQ